MFVGWGQCLCMDANGNTWANPTWEYNLYYWMYSDPTHHGNPINMRWASCSGLTVRYSLFYGTYGSGGLSEVVSVNGSSGMLSNAKIYGNVFDQCWTGHPIIGANSGNGIQNSVVYNNTFLRSALGKPEDGGGLCEGTTGSGNIFQNNLAFSCSANFGTGVSDDYNEYVYTTVTPTEAHGKVITANYDPFTSTATQIYTIKTNTIVGATLGAEYAFDALGNPRTTWSRGAFEYNSGPKTNAAIAVTPGSLDFGTIAVHATNDLSFRVQNVGGGTLSGIATVPAPFSILSGGAYSLGASQSQTVTVRYVPSAAGSYSTNVTFTGGGGTRALVSGVADAGQPVLPNPPGNLRVVAGF